MSNEILWLLLVIFDFSCLLSAFYFFGKPGLYAIVVFSTILCNLQVMKIITLFGLTVTLGNIVYSSIFLATNLLSEFYGKYEAQRAVNTGLASLVAFTIIMQITINFVPASEDIHHQALAQIFALTPRIAIASLTAYTCAQYHDIWLFNLIARLTNNKYLWLRKNISTLVSQLLDTIIFTFVAFSGVYPTELLIKIVFTTLIFKWAICILETPVIYIARHLHFQSAIAK